MTINELLNKDLKIDIIQDKSIINNLEEIDLDDLIIDGVEIAKDNIIEIVDEGISKVKEISNFREDNA